MCDFVDQVIELEAYKLLGDMFRRSERITSLEFKSALRAICNMKYVGTTLVSITQAQVGAFLRSAFFLGKFPDSYRARIRRLYGPEGQETAVYVEYYSEPCPRNVEGSPKRSDLPLG
jgi:hypothetical protein